MSLGRLNDLIKSIDTGLKAVVAIELARSGEISAPDLTRNFIDEGIIYLPEGKSNRKKIEAVKKAMEDLVGTGCVEKFDLGEKRFHTPSHTYVMLKSPNSRDLVNIAKRNIDICSQLEYPCHQFWDLKGGSYSTDLKHVRQGMQMATFYGIMPEDLEASVGTDIWENVEPETLPSCEIRQRLKLNTIQMKSYLTKFVKNGFLEQSGGIKNGNVVANPDLRNNGYCERRSTGNTRLYSLTDVAQDLVKDLFIPCLAVACGCSNGEIRETNAKFSDNNQLYEAEAFCVHMHYGSIKNQFSN